MSWNASQGMNVQKGTVVSVEHMRCTTWRMRKSLVKGMSESADVMEIHMITMVTFRPCATRSQVLKKEGCIH